MLDQLVYEMMWQILQEDQNVEAGQRVPIRYLLFETLALTYEW